MPMLAMFSPLEVAVVLGVGVVPYVVPTVIALARHKRSTGWIIALNLLLGWTVVGWVVALVWALVPDTPPAVMSDEERPGRSASKPTR